ncbi:hypothetical protein ABH935_006688 [Catenulispora sp. GAS73]
MVISFRRDQDRRGRLGGLRTRTWHGPTDPVWLPQDVLDRHGARILRPTTAVTFAGAPTPLSTIYRSAVLQVPNSFFEPENRLVLARLNEVLAAVGYRLAFERVRPLAHAVPDVLRRHQPHYPDVHRRVRIEVVAGSLARSVDAWLALQTLRAAVLAEPDLRDAVSRIELEHLLVGAVSLVGDPSTEGHPATEGQPSTEGHTGGWSYARAGSGGRAPVDVIAPAPRRRTLSQLGGRRPTVAVLDTGIGPHPWLDYSSDLYDDGFVLVDPAIQALLVAAEAAADVPEPLPDPVEGPVYDTPLLGELDTHSGHGTFIAGIIRQAAPDARVRSIRLMHDDGVVYENDLLVAFAELLAQVRYAQAGEGDPEQFVDVVSLSAGYYSENADDVAYTSQLASIIGRLADCGVLVVASAGNDSTDRPCYPAALPPGAGNVPVVISVGALNPNGSKAFFSNDGPWVRCWATGAAVISTYPTTYDGSEGALNSLAEANGPGLPQRRETIDPDDFRSGFATWSGTSFSAPLVAAALAAAVLFEAERDPAVGMEHLDASHAITRAARALRTVGG